MWKTRLADMEIKNTLYMKYMVYSRLFLVPHRVFSPKILVGTCFRDEVRWGGGLASGTESDEGGHGKIVH